MNGSLRSTDFEFRLRVLLVVFSSFFALLWARLFYLQVVRGETLRSISEANRSTVLFERAPRGLILDRNGVVLADSRPTFVVLFTPLGLNKKVYQDVIPRLSRILGEDADKLRRRLQPAIQHASMVRLMDRASKEKAFALAEQRPSLPGVSVVTEMQRRYPNGTMASHVLGYLGQINPAEYQKLKAEGYQQDWLVGKTGLEKVYDVVLRGRHGGTRIEVDAAGRSVKVLDRKEPVAGYQVTTTLDARVQKAAEDGLAETGKPGAVVAMDPRNGEILAFASAPPYDPNIFLYDRGELMEKNLDPGALLSNPELPLYDRTIQGMYPPGSIFKIITAAAALESGKIPATEEHFCPGFYILGSGPAAKLLHCWKHTGHGRVDFKKALAESCDVFFWKIALKIGPDAIESMSHRFGLGSPTGLEFPGEKAGLIPGRSMFKTGVRHWYDGDTLNMSIGQGTILFTPMQAAQMISAVANRGKLYRPRLVKEIRRPDKSLVASSAPELLSQFTLSDRTWDFLDDALTEVVENGTGQQCKIPGLRVAGKTGTAQNPHGKDHAWFVAFAPVDKPTIAVAVLVEHGVHGATTAAPIARKMIIAALGDRLSEEQTKSVAPPASGD